MKKKPSLVHCTRPRLPPLKITPEIATVRRMIRLIVARGLRGENFNYKQTLRSLRLLLLKLIEESRQNLR